MEHESQIRVLLYVDRFLYSRAGRGEPDGTDGQGADQSLGC